MTELATFALIPFEPLPGTMTLSVTGTLTREDDLLSIAYLMAGDLDAIAIPPRNTSSSRKDRLWEQTCFEFFLAAGPKKSDQDRYWEFNLSPTGDWNVFALNGYRNGLTEESAFSSLPFSVHEGKGELRLTILVDLSKVLPARSPWLLGVSTVAVLSDGTETFWAIAHPAPHADFHSAGSLTVQLSPSP